MIFNLINNQLSLYQLQKLLLQKKIQQVLEKLETFGIQYVFENLNNVHVKRYFKDLPEFIMTTGKLEIPGR
jgi:hypothetical protein